MIILYQVLTGLLYNQLYVFVRFVLENTSADFTTFVIRFCSTFTNMCKVLPRTLNIICDFTTAFGSKERGYEISGLSYLQRDGLVVIAKMR